MHLEEAHEADIRSCRKNVESKAGGLYESQEKWDVVVWMWGLLYGALVTLYIAWAARNEVLGNITAPTEKPDTKLISIKRMSR